MRGNNFTDKTHWEEYWENYQYDKIPNKVVFDKFTSKLSEGDSFIEIGGFPGVFAAYFFRKGIKNVSILDFHIDTRTVQNFEELNKLPKGTIRCIESDFFSFNSQEKYDVVFSSGFIEHFEDTRDVISRHVNLLSEKGQLLILLPNFLGLNGKIQRWFDKENLIIHNLKSMEISFLKDIAHSFNLQDVTVDYIGKPMVWLEPKPKNQNKRIFIKMLSYAIKLTPLKGKILSPYIAIYARK